MEELGVEVEELEAETGETDRGKEERLRLLADGGYNPIIAVGFAYAPAIEAVVGDYPDVNFGIIDDASFEADNTRQPRLRRERGLVPRRRCGGAQVQSDIVGFVGGVQVPLIHKFEVGYTAGAQAANPSIEVQSQYLTQPPDFTGFTDPAKGRTAARACRRRRGRRLPRCRWLRYRCLRGRCRGGQARDRRRLRPVPVGAEPATRDHDLDAQAGRQRGLRLHPVRRRRRAVDRRAAVRPGEGGIGYATSTRRSQRIADIETQLEDYKQQIIDGTITVPDKL